MITPKDHLDLIGKARTGVQEAERAVSDAARKLKDARESLRLAKVRFASVVDEVMSEAKQPRLPFDEVETAPTTSSAPAAAVPDPVSVEAPTWCKLTLRETGWEDEWSEEAWETIASRVLTAGELAEQLQVGETFGLERHELNNVYAVVEMISQDDEQPIKFTFPEVKKSARRTKKKPAPELPPGTPTPKAVGELPLWDVPKFPQEAADLLKERGVETLSQLAPHVERMITMGDASPVYAALRTTFKLAEPLVLSAGDALVDFLGWERFAPVPKHPAPPLDRTHVWEQRVADSELKNVAGQDPKRLRAQIADYRKRDDRGLAFGESLWGQWSEFDVKLTDGSPVRVLAKPEWNEERYLHHIEFWSDKVSGTNYWSITVDFTLLAHPPKALAEWCREHIQQQADSHQAEAAGDVPPVKIIDVLNLPKPKRVRKPKAVAQ